jgi:transposase
VLSVQRDDEITHKLVMLIQGECEGLGARAAATKHGYSRQRYYQLRSRFEEGGAAALQSAKRGPKTLYRRTPEVARQVIRQRFLDPDASAAVITQRPAMRPEDQSAQRGRVIEGTDCKKALQDHPNDRR